MFGLPQNWVVLKSFKGKYYPYVHERLRDERMQINDSTAIEYWMDGPEPTRIVNIKKIGERRYKLSIKSTYFPTTDTVNIYIVDDKNKIAVFEYSGENGGYSLMISADKIKNFPLMVNSNPGHRTGDFRGDDPVDFKKLIEGVREK